MNKEVFLNELERHLNKLPEVERIEAIEYYREYLEEAGDDVEIVIEKLGSPKEVANDIIRECAVKSLAVVSQGNRSEEKTTKQNTKNSTATNIWLIILGIFAAPIAFPLAIALVAVLFAGVVVVVSLGLSVVVLDVCLFAAGIVLFVIGMSVVMTSPVTTMFFVGCGLFVFGCGIVALIITIQVVKWIIKGITYLVSKAVKGGKQDE